MSFLYLSSGSSYTVIKSTAFLEIVKQGVVLSAELFFEHSLYLFLVSPTSKSLPRQLVFPPVSEKNSLPFLENPVIISLEEEDFKMILTPFKKYHNHNLRPPEHTITQKKIEYQNNCNTLLSHMARNPREDMRK